MGKKKKNKSSIAAKGVAIIAALGSGVGSALGAEHLFYQGTKAMGKLPMNYKVNGSGIFKKYLIEDPNTGITKAVSKSVFLNAINSDMRLPLYIQAGVGIFSGVITAVNMYRVIDAYYSNNVVMTGLSKKEKRELIEEAMEAFSSMMPDESAGEDDDDDDDDDEEDE